MDSAIDEVIAAAKWFEQLRNSQRVTAETADEIKKYAADLRLGGHKLQLKVRST